MKITKATAVEELNYIYEIIKFLLDNDEIEDNDMWLLFDWLSKDDIKQYLKELYQLVLSNKYEVYISEFYEVCDPCDGDEVIILAGRVRKIPPLQCSNGIERDCVEILEGIAIVNEDGERSAVFVLP